MPAPLLKACAHPGGCPALTADTYCVEHARLHAQQRKSASIRGYGAAWSRTVKRFRQRLVAAGIPVVCGARLPGAPETHDSRCRAEGLLLDDARHRLRFGMSLHVDHIVPLRDDERDDPRAVHDLLRLQLLCQPDHSRKTATEMERA